MPNQAFFADFDVHGGKFAAQYASLNLLRVLCRSTTFVEYAVRYTRREEYLTNVKKGLLLRRKSSKTNTPLPTTTSTETIMKRGGTTMLSDTASNPTGVLIENVPLDDGVTVAEMDTQEQQKKIKEQIDRLRLQQLKKRGHDSDKKVRAIKTQVRRNFGENNDGDEDEIKR